MTLTVGVNSYQLLTDITSYLSGSIRAATWPDLDTETQERAAITAFRILERQRWSGTPATGATCAFPRTGLVDLNGVALSDSSMPGFILAAQAEMAWDLSQDPDAANTLDTGQKVSEVSAGSAGVKFFKPTDMGRFSSAVTEIIAPYLAGASAVGSAVQAFGTCDESHFYAPDGVYPWSVN